MNAHAPSWFDLASSINDALPSCRIQGQCIDFGSLPCGHAPLDIDTFAMDNSDTSNSKELVGCTYSRRFGRGRWLLPPAWALLIDHQPVRNGREPGARFQQLMRQIACHQALKGVLHQVGSLMRATQPRATTRAATRDGRRRAHGCAAGTQENGRTR